MNARDTRAREIQAAIAGATHEELAAHLLSIETGMGLAVREVADLVGIAQKVRNLDVRLTAPREREHRWRPSGRTKGSSMRKQYYFRPSSGGLLSWDVDRLVQLSSHLPRKRIPLSQIRELDEAWFGEDERPTWRAMLEHMRLIDEADLSFPIIVSSTGAVMDGMHRIAKAVREGRTEIEAVQFDEDPEPDHVGLGPNELPN